MADIVTLREAVAGLVHDGDVVAMEGFTHLIPHAAGHELIRQGRRDLTLVRMTPDVVYDQLIGAGCADRLIFSWGGNPGVGSLHRFRDAIEHGWPTPLAIEEHSHAGMATRYAAGASGLPFGVLRGYVGTDLVEHTREHRPHHLPVHGRGAHGGAGAATRRRGHPRPAGRPQGQRAAVGAGRGAEGSRARGAAVDRHRGGGGRRAPAAAERRRAAGLGGRRRVRGARAAPTPASPSATPSGTTPSTSRGMRSARSATPSLRGSTSTCGARPTSPRTARASVSTCPNRRGHDRLAPRPSLSPGGTRPWP